MMKLAVATPNVAAKLAALPVALTTGSDAVDFDIVSVMSDAVSTTQGKIFAVLAVVVPAIVAIVAAIVGVKFGIGWLRKIKGD